WVVRRPASIQHGRPWTRTTPSGVSDRRAEADGHLPSSSGGGIRTPVTPVTTGRLAARPLPIVDRDLAPRRRIEVLSRPRQDRVCASKRPGRALLSGGRGTRTPNTL